MSKKVIVKHTDAEKFTVSNMLTVGKEYEVVNETEEYVFAVKLVVITTIISKK